MYKNEKMITLPEFIKAISGLSLIPEVCQETHIQQLFREIDTANTQKLTLDQLQNFINKVSIKSTKELQDEILEEICIKLRSTNAPPIDNIFKNDDPRDRGTVNMNSFQVVLMRQCQLKAIDCKFLAARYTDLTNTKDLQTADINYKKFIMEVNQKLTSVKLGGNQDSSKATSLFGPGLHMQDPNSDMMGRLKSVLAKINDQVIKTKVSLVNLFATYEVPGGFVSYDNFIGVLRGQNFPITNEDYRFLAENYMTLGQQQQLINTSMQQQQAKYIDYRKFLSDLKLYGGGEGSKAMLSLTQDQQKLYNGLTQDLRKKNKTAAFAQSFIQRDPSMKGYLKQQDLEDILKAHGYTFNKVQFMTFFGVLDSNAVGELNYKQLLELILGQEDANKFFSGVSIGSFAKLNQSQVQFVMPLQPIGAKSQILAEIGKKFIQSGKNYEEEFKVRIGEKQATSQIPKASEQEIESVMVACGIRLTQDERLTLQAYINSQRDQNGFVPLLEFLQSVGLPPQTLGLRGQKAMPKKILGEKERKFAQEILIKVRTQLSSMRLKPEEVFERCRANPKDLSIPEHQFRMVLQQPEFGEIGRSITPDQVSLLVAYLSQEVPGEISYKKLYLAFTQTDKDVPLSQEGIEEIKRYETVVREQARKGTPLELVELFHFMRQNSLSMPQIFKTTQHGVITRQEFEASLKQVGFKARDPLKLIEILDPKGTRQSVSLDKLNQYLARSPTEQRNITPQIARDKFQGFDPKVRQTLTRISEFLKRSNITLAKLHEMMDLNKDGMIDRDEFVSTMPHLLQIPGVEMRDYAVIFNAIDLNNSGSLSLHQFGLFIEGAKIEKMQRMQEIDPKMLQEMTREIQILFQQFDANGDGVVTADEIQRAMQGLGHRITIEEAKELVRQVDSNGDGRLELREFQELMLKQMKEELLSQEDNIEDLKAKFMDADIDHSGTLSVDEIYSVLLKMGAELTIDELVELMHEIDVDRSGQLDIDEFIALMTTTGDEIKFQSANAKNTLMSLKRARKLNPLDFFKCFKSMPQNFVPSFFAERWKKRKNLPSSVFMPQIDPRTMMYKDMLPVMQENIPPNLVGQKAFHPRLRPIPSEVGCQFLFESAQGVPLPQTNDQFDRSQIVKRAVRIGLYDTIKKDFLANSVQVQALYSAESAEDVWSFQALRDNGLNPVILRATNKDDILKPHIFIVFELLIYVRFGGTSAESQRIVEMSCGWCQLDIGSNGDSLSRQMTHKLAIKGGSPNAEIMIKDADVHTNRTGIKYQLMKVVNPKITSQLTVQVRPLNKFTDETRFHMEFLPSLCFLQKRLLYFVSGFRNYLGEKLLQEQSGGGANTLLTFKQPEGDAIVTTFAKVFDCPDITEQLVQIWSEDVWTTLNTKQKLNIEHLVLKTKEFLRKLYPVLYAEEFQFRESNTTASSAGDQYLSRKREDLIKSALRFGNPQAKVKADKPLEMLSSFKPFTIRELDFDVWDTSAAKQDMFLSQYEELGLIQSKQQPPQMIPGMPGLPVVGQLGAQPTIGSTSLQGALPLQSASVAAPSWDLLSSLNKKL